MVEPQAVLSIHRGVVFPKGEGVKIGFEAFVYMIRTCFSHSRFLCEEYRTTEDNRQT